MDYCLTGRYGHSFKDKTKRVLNRTQSRSVDRQSQDTPQARDNKLARHKRNTRQELSRLYAEL